MEGAVVTGKVADCQCSVRVSGWGSKAEMTGTEDEICKVGVAWGCPCGVAVESNVACRCTTYSCYAIKPTAIFRNNINYTSSIRGVEKHLTSNNRLTINPNSNLPLIV
ncbi:hypothetical protein SDC9_141144 [bioreactor metagenome]|uniref:Uncharacterized protein n=1 Tax=bioreactor metagenome TaxID=1076179 RepID=A0A645E085_9ZZZZ